MGMIHIKNWEQHQHYKDRRPAWIKLEIDIIEQFDKDGNEKKFYKLPDLAKLTYLCLLALRANYNDHCPYIDDKWLKSRLGLEKIDLQPIVNAGLITIDSNSVAKPYNSVAKPYDSVSKPYQVDTDLYGNDTPEKEREKEKEKE